MTEVQFLRKVQLSKLILSSELRISAWKKNEIPWSISISYDGINNHTFIVGDNGQLSHQEFEVFRSIIISTAKANLEKLKLELQNL